MFRRYAASFSRGMSLGKFLLIRLLNNFLSIFPLDMGVSNINTSQEDSVGGIQSDTFVIDDNEVLFFCDVDVLFSRKFLENCRQNTKLGKQVYFPILFSEYDKSKPGYASGVTVSYVSILYWLSFSF